MSYNLRKRSSLTQEADTLKWSKPAKKQCAQGQLLKQVTGNFEEMHLSCSKPKRKNLSEMDLSRGKPKRKKLSEIASVGNAKWEESVSPFENVVPNLTTDEISTFIREEMKRLKRRAHLHAKYDETAEKEPTTTNIEIERGSHNGKGTTADGYQELLGSSFSQKEDDDTDKPVFTFQQVRAIFEKIMKEREDRLKETFDKVLNQKLDDQYEVFVKFTEEQLRKNYEGAAGPSYLS